jgi:hypothetical protein
MVDSAGKRISLRAGDGIHFSPDGADFLAETVYEALDAQWHITAQKVEGQDKAVRVTKGSTQVGGTYRDPATSSGGSGSSSRSTTYRTSTTTRAYTPPTSAPPATTPTTAAPPPATTPPSTTPTPSSTTPAG